MDECGTEAWCAQVEIFDTANPFVCVSVLKGMDWDALTIPQVTVSKTQP